MRGAGRRTQNFRGIMAATVKAVPWNTLSTTWQLAESVAWRQGDPAMYRRYGWREVSRNEAPHEAPKPVGRNHRPQPGDHRR